MSKPYNQWVAMLAITKASLRAVVRSPSSVLFSLFFPLVFILVFGFIGNGGGPSYRLVLAPGSDTANAVIDSLKAIRNVKFVTGESREELESELLKGQITGVLSVQKMTPAQGGSDYNIRFQSTTASADKVSSFLPLLENVISKIDKRLFVERQTYARVQQEIREVRPYRAIDFILPGQLGFSLLSASVFGVAFLFFNLRQLLVLKRFYATPIRRIYIILGEALSRVIFQMVAAVIIIAIGHYAFQFTLVNGWVTFLEIMVLSFIALLVFMAFGFVVSGIAKSVNTIPPLANVVALPQFLLAGTFFPIDVFPGWLQPISQALPLTFFNDAMRRIAFEGAHLTDCWGDLLALLLWGVVAFAIAVKVFKWE
ncbi:ABC transporter permease [Paraflavisolibacter sp. H34]|uniref:ABC transporter permease n=1 Tax=Huijunlia imazamoxiresistens TaxID=3127457 RepID=UPI003016EA5B